MGDPSTRWRRDRTAGCAAPPALPKSYVVLLPSPDGTVGNVTVQGAGGSQSLSKALQGVDVSGGKAPVAVSQEEIYQKPSTVLSEVLQISKPNLKMQEKEDSVQVGHGLSWTKTTCFRSEVRQIRTIHSWTFQSFREFLW